jgi:hypothetical protein
LTEREDGKKRALNVWRYDIPAVAVYMTVKNGDETARAIRSSYAKAGVEAGNGWPLDSAPAFIDWPFTDSDAGFEEHLAKVREYKPQLTVAPDVEDGRTLDDVLPLADKLAEHADDVIIVPKECHPTEIPDQHRVGLTVGRFGSMSPWGVWEYRECESVHILGGSPSEQLEVAQCGVPVASADSFSLGRRAKYGMWDGGAVDAPDSMDYYERLLHSLNNFTKALSDYAPDRSDKKQ